MYDHESPKVTPGVQVWETLIWTKVQSYERDNIILNWYLRFSKELIVQMHGYISTY